MLPSIVAEQVRQGLADYLRATFEMSTPLFRNLLEDFLREEGSLFRGPYLSLGLPFAQGRAGRGFFPEIPLRFPPHKHQEAAFTRLAGDAPRSTLVATGTGSGKTECFLYPVLEHCRRQQHRKGVKALLIYPMNALATDQALRIAQIVDATPALKGAVRAGLYVGQREAAPKATMGERHVITDRNILRQNPPDILLTNYKMLDYLLLRHEDRSLWQHNEPDTLRFLVVDELHTFDGAQGTDLACLIRRLKARLFIAPRELCCVGTSATLGSGENAQRLPQYAQDIFGEPFDTGALITEQRISAAEFLGEAVISHSQPPAPEDEDALNPENHTAPLEYLAAQYGLWFDKAATPGDMESDSFRVGLGDELREHLFFQNLVRGMKGKITSLDGLLEIMRPFFPKGRGRESRYQVLALLSLLSLISHARRTVTVDTEDGHDSIVLPLLSVRLQHWLRELVRMVVSVEPLNEESGSRPRLRFSADLPEQTPCRHLPLVRCRECGAAGWTGLMDVNRSHYRTDLPPIYKAFFSKKSNNAQEFHFFFPEVEEAQASQADGNTAYICGSCRGVQPRTAEDGACKGCHSGNVVRVFMPSESSKDCPFCRSHDSMLLLGARAASLTSAIISLQFASRYNEDKKLIAFSDNVQDASHRAGFIGARSFGFTLRAAIQQCLREQGTPPTLAAFPERFCDHWRKRLGEKAFIAMFIHPGMEWRYHYDYLKKNGRLPSQSPLPGWIDKRLGWEIYSAYGLNARIGRTMEKTSASIAHAAPEILKLATQRLGPILANEFEPLRDCGPEQTGTFIAGLITHLRHNGAVLHPVLEPYIRSWGRDYLISQAHIPWMPNFGFTHKVPRMLTSRFGVERFEQVFAPVRKTWCVSWAIKCFPRLTALGQSFVQGVYDHALAALGSAGLLAEFEVQDRGQVHRVWCLKPEALMLSTMVAQLKCSSCGYEMSAAEAELPTWESAPCHRAGCGGRYALLSCNQPDYYGRLYGTGQIVRLFTAEHTGLLKRDEREKLEEEFKGGEEGCAPWAANLLSCTPTLEMGIDIGSLSSTVQCSVPPSQANYLQRVGRAGRRDGNALNVTIANASPHDLYFFENPLIMMAGDVEPPGVFLNASAVLERQLTGFCMDRWVMTGIGAKDIPEKLIKALSAVEKRNETAFPYNLLQFIETNASDILERFIAIFEGRLSSEVQMHLKRFIHGSQDEPGESQGPMETPLAIRILEGLGRVFKERRSLSDKANKANKLLRRLQDDPAGGQSTKERIVELRREVVGLRKLATAMGQKNIFNFLTDEGLIPNYAFPEQGVTLHSIIFRKKEQQDQDGEYDVVTYDYERAAQSAITEFAPGNTFYAGKRKVRIDQVDVETSEVQDWRLCPDCSHTELAVLGESNGACPSCGSELFADAGQKRKMLRMSQVFANTPDSRSRVGDESERREPQFYVRQLLVDYKPTDVTEAWKLDTDETVFGYAFLSRANFREINFGSYADEESGFAVAGEEMPRQGFRICALCGKLLTDRNTHKDHAWGCPSRKEDAEEKVLECVYLFRDFNSEAIKVLLPFTGTDTSAIGLESFVAAFNLGLKLRFGGSIVHLRSTSHTEPDIQDRSLRKQFLVIYDSVPGGTGYLKELMRDDRIFEVLQMALEHLRACKCSEKPELDGCYKCLLAYRNSMHMDAISKQRAILVLQELLRHKDKLVHTAELRSISLSSLFESELEVRFIEALRRQNSEEVRVRLERQIVNGREGFFLEAGDCRWYIEQQVDLGPAEGVLISSRADFLFTPARSNMDCLPIAVFTDGYSWHKERIGHDMAQRMSIVRSGRFHVWSLSYHDVQVVFEKREDDIPDFIQHDWSAIQEKLWERAGLTPAQRMENRNSFRMLFAFLCQAKADIWRHTAETYALCSISGPIDAEERAGKCLALAELFPENLVHCAMLENAGYFGEYSAPCTRRFFSAQRDPQAYSAALFLDDADDNRESEAFVREWGGFLRAYNLFQFIRNSAAIARSGLVDGLYQDIHPVQERQEMNHASAEQQAAWEELKELVSDAFLPLLERLLNENAIAPTVGLELEKNGHYLGQVELAWPQYKIGVIEQAELHLQNSHKTHGWELFSLQEATEHIERILDTLKQGANHGY